MFQDRNDAGRQLADALRERFGGTPGEGTVILAIPRGGVIVAAEVARRLNAPLDIAVPRKIPSPYNPELAVGAVAPDGSYILTDDPHLLHGVNEAYLQRAIAGQRREIERRMRTYRGSRPFPELRNRTVILVDDGVATGLTTRAALRWIAAENPARLVLAVPVAPDEVVEALAEEVDDLVCLSTPDPFLAVGQFYRNFEQTSDEEVIATLAAHNRPGAREP